MRNGNFLTGEKNMIRFKCTKCGFVDEMERDIAEEVLDIKKYKGVRCYYAYCIKCDSVMYPLDLMENKEN